MAVAVLYEFPGMTQEQYDRLNARSLSGQDRTRRSLARRGPDGRRLVGFRCVRIGGGRRSAQAGTYARAEATRRHGHTKIARREVHNVLTRG